MDKKNEKLILELNEILGLGETSSPSDSGPFGIVDIKKYIQSSGDMYSAIRLFAKTKLPEFNTEYLIPLESILAIDKIVENKLIVISTVPNFNIKLGEIFTPDLKRSKEIVNLISSYRANEIIPISVLKNKKPIDLVLPLSVLVYKIADKKCFSDLTTGGLLVKAILNQLNQISIKFEGIDYLYLSQSDDFIKKTRELINSKRNTPELINPSEIQQIFPELIRRNQ